MSILDAYEHVGPIGDGFFSLVKRYRHRDSNDEIAVKMLKDSFKDNDDYIHRFEREVELITLLRGHPNIIEILGHEFDEGRRFYIMPVASANLLEHIAKHNSTLSLRERLELFDQVLSAVKYAQSKGVLHRDISPRNILLFEKESSLNVRVSDFGLAKNLDADSGWTRSAVSAYGQMYYVAPEQYDRLKDATERSEVFSLGKLLDFTLTGKIPVVAHNTPFKTLIEKATNEDPDDRYGTLEEFERVYQRIRNLLVVDEEGDPVGTITRFTNPDGSIDFVKFHRFALRKDPLDNSYYEYLEPVLKVLLERERLETYLGVAGDSIEDFVKAFIKQIDDLPSVNWPFSATTKFGELLSDIFLLTDQMSVKIQCFQMIWSLAFEQEQYGCQDIAFRLLKSGSIPESIQMEISISIINSTATVSADAFSSPRIPEVIRRAILQKANE